MTRRAFIELLCGATVGAAIIAKLDALPRLSDRKLWDATFREIHEAAWQEFLRAMRTHQQPLMVFPQAAVFGDLLPNGANATSMFGVDCVHHGNYRMVSAAMAMLAERCAWEGLDSFGHRATGLAVTTYADNVGALRMVVAYHIQRDENVVRFDVVGGRQAAGLSKYRTSRIKSRILQRLPEYARLPIPA